MLLTWQGSFRELVGGSIAGNRKLVGHETRFTKASVFFAKTRHSGEQAPGVSGCRPGVPVSCRGVCHRIATFCGQNLCRLPAAERQISETFTGWR
jgi:hypothetical protein